MRDELVRFYRLRERLGPTVTDGQNILLCILESEIQGGDTVTSDQVRWITWLHEVLGKTEEEIPYA